MQNINQNSRLSIDNESIGSEINQKNSNSDSLIHVLEIDTTDEPNTKRIKRENLQIGDTALATSETVPLVSNNQETIKFENEKLTNTLQLSTNNSSSSKPLIKEESNTTKLSKATTPVPSIPKEELVSESGRKVEDIIDGSDLRRFLNKTLSGYLVKGLEEIVKLWENGEFNADAQEDSVIKQQIMLKFADILKDLAAK